MSWVRTPLAPIALAFAAGVALVSSLTPRTWWTVWLVAALTTAIGIVRQHRATATVTLLVVIVALGALRATPLSLPAEHVGRLDLPRVARIEGHITEEPVRSPPDRQRIVIDVERVDDVPRSGLVQLGVYGEAPVLAEGQRLAVDARLRHADGFRNPRGFDYGAFLRRQGIHVVGSALPGRVTVVEERMPWHARVKRGAVAAMERALPPVSGALLAGLLLGAQNDLPRETLDDFRRAGVYHVLAVSGFNVALVASSAFTAALLARASRRAAASTALVAVLGFTLVVGPQPSVLRASIMAVLVLAALLADREAHVVNSLALSAVIVLAVRPGDLLDPGFQLSYAATAGLVLAPMPRGILLGALGVSVAAGMAVLPITLTHFNQVSTVGVLANLGVVPLAAAATVLGLVAVALSAVSDVIAAPMFEVLWPILLAMRAVVRASASIPGALVHLPAPHWAAIVCYVASLSLALTAWHVRGTRPVTTRLVGVTAACLLIAACVIEAWPVVGPGDGRLRVTVLDIGQGDAIVVESPDRQTLLVDAGAGGPGRLDIGERVVAPYLWNHGTLRLAAAITTHDDADHAGGMTAVHQLFRVREDLDPRTTDTTRWLGPVAVSVVRPGPAVAPDRHGHALVVRLDYGLATFLLASDIGALSEQALLRRGTALGAVVLKVAHHGARSSSTTPFLEAVHPSVAVISVGARNAYGHPDPGALARLDAVHARVYRTDRHGAIVLETDGHVLDVTRWADRTVDRYCLDPEATCERDRSHAPIPAPE